MRSIFTEASQTPIFTSTPAKSKRRLYDVFKSEYDDEEVEPNTSIHVSSDAETDSLDISG